MSSAPTQSSSAAPSLLSLPLEIRQIIYSHLIPPVLIFPHTAPHQTLERAVRHRPPVPSSTRSNSYLHPFPPSPLIHGFANKTSRFHLPIHSYPVSARAHIYSIPSRPSQLPLPAQLVSHQLYSELTAFALSSGAWTFCFHDFSSLIRFLKGRGSAWSSRSAAQRESFLAQVTSVIIELRLNLTAAGKEFEPPTAAMQLADRISRHETNTRRDLANVHQNGLTVTSQRAAEDAAAKERLAWMTAADLEMFEEDMPWLDALRLMARAFPRLHTLGLHAELTGPEIQVLGFGDSKPRDWPPGATQARADFGPVLDKLCGFVEGFKGLRRCGVTVWAGHQLKNLAADPGDGSLAARFWEEAELEGEVEGRVRRCERGLGGEELGEGEGLVVGGFEKAVEIDLAERRRKTLAVKGRDMNWY